MISYEFLVASAIGVLVAGGIFLALRARTFQVVLGLTLISYAVNLFLFASGRLVIGRPPIWDKTVTEYTDPLPQALVLTAIVITFGMTAFIVILALRSFLETGSDHVDGDAVPCDDQDGLAACNDDAGEGEA
jgi:multicomponent K+:H+ antiporter subunit C